MAKVEQQFDPLVLPAAHGHAGTQGAQERLTAALESVNNALLTMSLSRAANRAVQKKDLRGRLSETQLDILRAAIAFAGAGLDAALKKLIKDTVRDIALRIPSARRKFLDFIDRHLAASDQPVDRRRLAEILVDGRGSQAALLESYERELTGDSLQSVDQVNVVCGALGIDTRTIRERLKPGATLDQMFRARNDIVHQLDLTDRGRKARTFTEVREFAMEALAVTQEIINAVATTLEERVL
ncbi:MAG: hypothetical protein FJX73_05500 [Armatimonadetes bacterium]|nr:hypothetical protein [Armatimonadota bacterium]